MLGVNHLNLNPALVKGLAEALYLQYVNIYVSKNNLVVQ